MRDFAILSSTLPRATSSRPLPPPCPCSISMESGPHTPRGRARISPFITQIQEFVTNGPSAIVVDLHHARKDQCFRA